VRVSDSLGKVDNFDADVNPRIGLIFYPLERINIKALYSSAYRAPSIDELYLDHFAIHGKMIPPTNPVDKAKHVYDLKPEKVHTFDLGANFQDKSVAFGFNGFYSKMKNLIIQDRINYTVTTWDNIGEISIFGLECEGKYYMTKALLFEGSLLYQQSRDEKTLVNNVTPLPNFSAKGGLSYQADQLTLSIFNTFRQGLDEKFGSKLNPSSVNKQPSYYNMADVHLKYDFSQLVKFKAFKELSLVVQIDNLLNEEVWVPAWGNVLGSTVPFIQGRTIYGGFKVGF
jgi:outer membrane receptor protein involved in Fe transport